jgi:predicted O-methyltransferase YrrM
MSRCLASSVVLAALAAARAFSAGPAPQPADPPPGLDERVRAFLEERRGTWRDMNVPEVDGRTLHDLVLKHRFTRALEIGTSTGHSGIWIAWALSRTGGRLVTIEIDRRRHDIARANFERAGLLPYVDLRLGDAHAVVRTLDGPFDFVFVDAEKEGYPAYLEAIWPRLAAGGCLTAHNVSGRFQPGIREFLDRLSALPDARTTIDRSSGAGLSISCKIGGQAIPFE